MLDCLTKKTLYQYLKWSKKQNYKTHAIHVLMYLCLILII